MLSEAVLGFAVPEARLWSNGPGLIAVERLLGSAVSTFAIGGIIPMTYWAVRRFRRESANAVTAVWMILIGVFIYFQYYGLAK